jgi:hypothetical protein
LASLTANYGAELHQGILAQSAGIDTWKLLWKIDPEGFAAAHMGSLASSKSARGYLLPEAVGGYRVGWYPGPGVIYAEGHPGGTGLAGPATLVEAKTSIERELLAVDVPIPEGLAFTDYYGEHLEGFAGVSRLDSTVDLWTGSTSHGAAIMAGVAAMLGQAGKQELWRNCGHLETVTLHGRSGKRVLGRWYDKGVEAGTAPVGRLLRPEDQRRWPREMRRDVSELTGQYVRSKFHDRFVPLWRASKGVTVAGVPVIADKLLDAVDEGRVTIREAESLGGHLLLNQVAARRLEPQYETVIEDGRQVERLVNGRQSRWTRNRRRTRLQELGLILADGVLEEVEVSLEEVMTACLDAEGWGVG